MNKRCKSSFLLSCLIYCLPVFLTSGSQAQTPRDCHASACGSLEEIVVTARKREESLQDTPISITAFTGADLEARQLDDISQIAESTPNLVFDDGVTISGSSASSSVFIRGVGQLDFTFNSDPGVGIYVDGVYLSRSIGGLVHLLDIERIEVLRGPQGTLFGRNTTGGAINITTRKPENEFSGKAGINAGRYDRIEGYASVNLPISDTLLTRTSFSVRKRDGYVDRLQGGDDYGDVDAFSGRSIINWRASDNLEVTIAVDGTRERQTALPVVLIDDIDETGFPFALSYNNAIAGPPCVPPPSPRTNAACYNNQWREGTDKLSTNAGHDSKSDLDLWGLSGTITWGINDNLSVKSITAIRDFESLSTMDLDGSPLPVFDIDLTQDMTAVSQEFQILGNSFDDRLSWILGAFYLNEDARHFEAIQATFDFSLLPPPAGFPLVATGLTSGGDTTNESIAIFAQGTYNITDKLSLTAGLRYTDETRKFTPDSRLGPIRLLPQQAFKTSADELTPMVNLAYAWSDDLNLYITYSKGFKGGGFSQRIAQPNPAPPAFEPEIVKVIEGGLKLRAWENRLLINAAAFHSDYSDIQVLGQAPGVIGDSTINAGEADIDGFELEISAVPVTGLLLQGGVGYLDAEYTKLSPGVVNITLDSRLPSAPKWTTNFSASYEYTTPSANTITPRIDWFYTSTTTNVSGDFPSQVQDGYSLLNASVAFETTDGKWRAALSGKNLTDEIYLVSGDETAAIGTVYGTYGLPRTWAFNLERRF